MLWRWKKVSAGGIILVAGLGIWLGQSVNGQAVENRYVLASVEKGTLITSVAGIGQVKGEAEIEVNSEASGKAVSVAVKNGQHVESGDVLVVLDSTEAAKTVRDARLSLASANLSLQKLQASADALSLLQAQNALSQAERDLAAINPDAQEIQTAENTVTQAEHDLEKAQRDLEEIQVSSEQDILTASENGYNEVAETFTELSAVMADLADFIGTELSQQEYIGYYDLLAGSSYTDSLLEYYDNAEDSYNAAWAAYRVSDRDSDTEIKIETIELTLLACKDISDTLNDAQTILNKIQEENYDNSAIKDHIDDLIVIIPGDILIVNSRVSSLQSASDTIKNTDLTAPYNIIDAEDAVLEATTVLETAENNLADLQAGADPDEIAAAEESVAEKKQQLADLEAGTDAIDLQTQQLVVEDRQNSLNDALDNYENYTVRAPISGTVANFSVYRGQNISSSSSLSTIVADQLTATVSLNEVDVAKIEIGNKVVLTFDAIEDLTITGEVAEIDSIGSTSSGVVSYDVLAVFDTQDDRVLSGMSVSATITTAMRQDVLVISSTAIKSQADFSYIEVIDGADSSDISLQGITSTILPRQVTVEVGLSNDTETEIISGLSEGDLIIIRTISGLATSSSTKSSTPSLLSGGSGGPPGGFRD